MTLEQRANKVIAHGALTNSKRPASFVRGIYPTHIRAGEGATVFSEDGDRYIDFICGLGAVLLGHGNGDIARAIDFQYRNGSIHSLGTKLEVEFAEKICERFHFDQIRILKSGTEGCAAAIRIARAATGRDLILSDHYHGWSDEFVSLTPPAIGVPVIKDRPIKKLTDSFDWSSVAGVIVEPTIGATTPQRLAELSELRAKCNGNGAVLIFDETITALRVPRGTFGIQYGIEPDLTVMGKALAAGLPISIVGGKRQIMSADYFVSSTFAGDTIAMRASLEMFKLLDSKYPLSGICDAAKGFQEQFNAISPLAQIDGYGMRGVFKGESETLALFFQECCKAGILFGPSFFWMLPHSEHTQHVIKICSLVLSNIKRGDIKLQGEMPVKPFAQKVRDQ